MSLLSYAELVQLIQDGVIDAPLENVNQASIDVTLGENFIFEDTMTVRSRVIDLMQKENIPTLKHSVGFNGSIIIAPGQFFMAETRETFNLPNDIVAEFVLKSSQARNALEHLLAGYCDPGWYGSRLTMEFVSCLKMHSLRLTVGMKIGQVKFYRVTPVPPDKSYAMVGQYNNQKEVTESKGIK